MNATIAQDKSGLAIKLQLILCKDTRNITSRADYWKLCDPFYEEDVVAKASSTAKMEKFFTTGLFSRLFLSNLRRPRFVLRRYIALPPLCVHLSNQEPLVGDSFHKIGYQNMHRNLPNVPKEDIYTHPP